MVRVVDVVTVLGSVFPVLAFFSSPFDVRLNAVFRSRRRVCSFGGEGVSSLPLPAVFPFAVLEEKRARLQAQAGRAAASAIRLFVFLCPTALLESTFLPCHENYLAPSTVCSVCGLFGQGRRLSKTPRQLLIVSPARCRRKVLTTRTKQYSLVSFLASTHNNPPPLPCFCLLLVFPPRARTAVAPASPWRARWRRLQKGSGTTPPRYIRGVQ